MKKLYSSFLNSIVDDFETLKKVRYFLYVFSLLPLTFLLVNIKYYWITLVVEVQVFILWLVCTLKINYLKEEE